MTFLVARTVDCEFQWKLMYCLSHNEKNKAQNYFGYELAWLACPCSPLLGQQHTLTFRPSCSKVPVHLSPQQPLLYRLASLCSSRFEGWFLFRRLQKLQKFGNRTCDIPSVFSSLGRIVLSMRLRSTKTDSINNQTRNKNDHVRLTLTRG